MNKYLLLCAAAASATGAASANAASFSVHYGSSTGASYCDGLVGNIDGNGSMYWGYHVYTTCGYSHNLAVIGVGGNGYQGGLRNGVIKKSVAFSDQTFAFLYGGTENYAILFDVQKPIEPGKHWCVWVYNDFSSSVYFNCGILLPGQFDRHRPARKSQSSVSKLIEGLKLKPVVAAK